MKKKLNSDCQDIFLDLYLAFYSIRKKKRKKPYLRVTNQFNSVTIKSAYHK
jgi:hypothetical protein